MEQIIICDRPDYHPCKRPYCCLEALDSCGFHNSGVDYFESKKRSNGVIATIVVVLTELNVKLQRAIDRRLVTHGRSESRRANTKKKWTYGYIWSNCPTRIRRKQKYESAAVLTRQHLIYACMSFHCSTFCMTPTDGLPFLLSQSEVETLASNESLRGTSLHQPSHHDNNAAGFSWNEQWVQQNTTAMKPMPRLGFGKHLTSTKFRWFSISALLIRLLVHFLDQRILWSQSSIFFSPSRDHMFSLDLSMKLIGSCIRSLQARVTSSLGEHDAVYTWMSHTHAYSTEFDQKLVDHCL